MSLHSGIITDADGRIVSLDSMFKALLTIDVGHYEIHDGDSFRAAVVDDTMAATETLSLGFMTPAGTRLHHVVVGWAIKAAGHVELLERPVWTTNTGTVTPAWNRNRDSANVSGMLEDKTATPAFTATGNLLRNPTITAPGTVITLGYGFAAKQTGNQGRESAEWVCEPNTAYVVRLTADANVNGGFIELDWYEHTSA